VRRLLPGALLLTFCHVSAAADDPKPSAAIATSETGSEPASDIWATSARPLASSRWVAAQEKRAREALNGNQYDILVVPVQAGLDSLDHRGRALMTYSLAQAIATRSDLRVADPSLVAKAFGLNARQIPDSDIKELATELKVSKILIGAVAHDGAGGFEVRMRTVTLEYDQASRVGETEQVRSYPDNVFSDASPPIIGFGAIRDTILEDSGIRLRKQPKFAVDEERRELPNSAEDMLNPASAESAVFALQLLGTLIPPDQISQTRDHLFERSLVLMELVSRKSPHYKLMLARAFLYLGRRPAAVAILGDAEDPALRALLAYANGNIELLTAATDTLPPGLLSVMAKIERERLRLNYGASYNPELVDQTLAQEPLWGSLLAQAMVDSDPWRSYTHVPLKLALDAMYPEKRFDLESYATARIAVGQFPEEYDIAALLLEHLENVEKNKSFEKMAGPFTTLSLRTGDITDTFRDLLVATVGAESRHKAADIGKARSAIELLKQYEPLLADHPALSSSALAAYRYLGSEVSGREEEYVRDRVNAFARQTIDFNAALTTEIVEFAAWGRLFYPEQKLETTKKFDRFMFRTDWPQPPDPRPNFMAGTPVRTSLLLHCLAYTLIELDCLKNLHDLYLTGQNMPDEDKARALIKDNAHRFIGHPDRPEFMAYALRRAGRLDAADQLHIDAIDSGTTQWTPYEQIARKLHNESRFAEALNTILRYPGLQDAELVGAVAQSNRAYDFGSLFYWAGAYEPAATLYEIAAASHTGSGAEMASAQRLALIDGDYELAQYHTARRIRRYESKFAVRDLIGLSVIAGNQEQAWSIVSGFQPMFDQPELWVGALIAHRSEDRALESVVEWAYEDGREGLGSTAGLLSIRFAFLAHTLDRTPSAALGKMLRTRWTGSPIDLMPNPLLMLSRELPFFEVRYRGDLAWRNDKKIDSLLIVAADAMIALESQDYRAAFERLDLAADYYELGEFLPAYAWAAAKTGQTARIKGFLGGARNYKRKMRNQANSRNKLFDENLAEAMLFGAAGQVPEAIDHLKKANALIVHNGNRFILTRYQIMESARLLYEDTKEPAYRDFALDLARRNAVIEPIQGYAHSFVAMLSGDRQERIISLARVLVLDPQSRSIEKADSRELEEARKLAARGYPMPTIDTRADT
tara:strand:- start:10561 stop:14031 length:3471 start_codon:yes stop_codon:yes gene_type:complete